MQTVQVKPFPRKNQNRKKKLLVLPFCLRRTCFVFLMIEIFNYTILVFNIVCTKSIRSLRWENFLDFLQLDLNKKRTESRD